MKLDEFLWVFIFNDCWWLLLQSIALNLERLKVVSSPRSTLVACTPDSFITSACGLPTYIRKCCPCWANWRIDLKSEFLSLSCTLFLFVSYSTVSLHLLVLLPLQLLPHLPGLIHKGSVLGATTQLDQTQRFFDVTRLWWMSLYHCNIALSNLRQALTTFSFKAHLASK